MHPFAVRMLVAATMALPCCTAMLPAGAEEIHALSMHGDAVFPDGIPDHFPWVNPQARKGGALNLAIVGTFDSMNPYIVRGIPARGLRALVFQSLLYRSPDEPFTLYPQVARTIDMADDRTHIVFHLDPRARFHDGTPVTADDVVFTFDALRNDGRPHTQTYFSGVTGVRKLGPLAVSFNLRGDNWELPLLLGLMPVLSKTSFETVTFTGTSLAIPVGTGPYRVESIDPGHQVTYRRDPDYWGRDLPQSVGRYNFDTITYTWYRDSAVAHQAFLAGDSNIRFEGDPRRWVTGYDVPARDDGDIIMASVASGRPSGLYAAVWNHRRPPFDDVRVREALGLAFDFDWINDNLLHGRYTRTTSLFGGSALQATGAATGKERSLLEPWRDDLDSIVFDEPWSPTAGTLRQRLKEATGLLQEAGYVLRDGVLVSEATDEPLTFELLLNDPGEERIFLVWFANLERLGIRPLMRTVDAAQHRNRIRKFDFDAITWRWGVSLSPGNEQRIYWAGSAADDEGSRNYAGVRSPVLDSIISSLSDARSREDLEAAARALDRVLMWGRHVLPLYHRTDDLVAYRSSLRRPQRPVLYGADIWAWWHEPP